MGFNNYHLNVILRAVVLVASTFLLGHLIYTEAFFLTWVFVFMLILFQIINLVLFLDSTNKAIARFFEKIKTEDFDENYKAKDTGDYYDILNNEFLEVIKVFKQKHAEKDEQYQYIKTIIRHAAIGLITYDDEGEIQIINRAAKELLGIENVTNIAEFATVNNQLVDSLRTLRTGGRALVKLDQEGDPVQLSMYVIELKLKNTRFKLVSLQNIQSELEEKEMEAWQNLVRVLTHEIMNSVTPISSLAEFVKKELEAQLRNDLEVNAITNDEVKDLYTSIETIHKRSAGLIRFVTDFRNLTIIPKPNLTTVEVAELFHHVCTLMQFEIDQYDIDLIEEIDPEDAKFCVDQELLSQVLINLIKNAVESLHQQEKRKINLSFYYDDHENPIIKVADNGEGIDEEALQKIFIPFYTTKRKGSGIGLSLSRQIMRQHGGNISVKTRLGVGTEFMLRFNKELCEAIVLNQANENISS